MDTNSCGAIAEMFSAGDGFECGLSAVDANSCGAAEFYLEASGSLLGRDSDSFLMIFVLSRIGPGKYGRVRHIVYYSSLPPLHF